MSKSKKRKVATYMETIRHYPGSAQSFYKTITRPKTTIHGTDLSDIEVQYSPLDGSVAAGQRNKALMRLNEDGNGLLITSRGNRLVYLGYCEALELLLCLQKHYKDLGIKLQRIKKVRF